MMKKGFTPLTSNKAMWRAKFKEEEAKLAKERMEITPSEQVTFLAAAVKDVISLDNLTNLTCTNLKNGLRVEDNNNRSWVLTYNATQQPLPKTKKALQGKAHWILRTEDKDYDFGRIDQLISAFRAAVHNQPIDNLDDLIAYQKEQQKKLRP